MTTNFASSNVHGFEENSGKLARHFLNIPLVMVH
jgi:hypothetical protein